MDSMSTATPAIISAVASAAIALWGSRRTFAQSRRLARDERRRRAAEAVRDVVWELRDLVWEALIGASVDGVRVARTAAHIETTIKRFEDLIPDGARHLRRSCREAASQVFGGPGAAGLSADAAQLPTDPLEPYWVDITLTWLEHAAYKLHQWEDQPSARRLSLEPFDSWRRAEDEAWRNNARTTADIPLT